MGCSFKRGLDSKPLQDVNNFLNSNAGNLIKSTKDTTGKSVFQVCIRNNYINIYWCGCSVLKYNPQALSNGNRFLIHNEYVDSSENFFNEIKPYPYIRLRQTDSDLITIHDKKWSFIKNIVNKVGQVDFLKKCREEGEKKKLSDYLAMSKDTFIDLEIAFSRKISASEKQERKLKKYVVANRIDLARLNSITGVLQLVEVKLATDSRLRSTQEPKVMDQMRYYQEFITTCTDEILNSYKKIASNLKDLGYPGYQDYQIKLIEKFALNPSLDQRPYLLILEDKNLNDNDNEHLGRLGDLFKDKGYPNPERVAPR